jgi:hypothetical protein
MNRKVRHKSARGSIYIHFSIAYVNFAGKIPVPEKNCLLVKGGPLLHSISHCPRKLSMSTSHY